MILHLKREMGGGFFCNVKRRPLKPNPPIGERGLKEIHQGGSGEERMARSAGSNFASGLY